MPAIARQPRNTSSWTRGDETPATELVAALKRLAKAAASGKVRGTLNPYQGTTRAAADHCLFLLKRLSINENTTIGGLKVRTDRHILGLSTIVHILSMLGLPLAIVAFACGMAAGEGAVGLGVALGAMLTVHVVIRILDRGLTEAREVRAELFRWSEALHYQRRTRLQFRHTDHYEQPDRDENEDEIEIAFEAEAEAQTESEAETGHEAAN